MIPRMIAAFALAAAVAVGPAAPAAANDAHHPDKAAATSTSVKKKGKAVKTAPAKTQRRKAGN